MHTAPPRLEAHPSPHLFMKYDLRHPATPWTATILSGLLLMGCSGSSSGSGNGGSSTNSNQFSLATVSVDAGQVWQINRPIAFTFSEAVDFDTVNLNTINIQEVGGAPAVGDFSMDPNDSRTVLFQPVCPTSGDFSDAGFRPGGVSYQVNVADQNGGATTVRSVSGRSLSGGSTRTFTTPDSSALDVLFLDTIPGPPSPLLRPTVSEGSYVEIGGDPDNRQYFEVGSGGGGSLPGGFRVPNNFYSDQNTRIVVVIEMNQAVSPTPENISTSRVTLQFDDGSDWVPIPSSIELVANCTASGATMRLSPIGVVPQGRPLRVVVSPQFEDIVGDRNIVQLDDFANMESDFATTDGTTPAITADEFVEQYLNQDFEDTTAALDAPRATWGAQSTGDIDGLSASFAFDGTGGPNGEFDLFIPPNTDLIFDTTSTLFIGGPGGVPQFTQLAVNGRLDVRDLFIPESSTMRIQGPNPARILAAGVVTINGKVIVDGSNAAQVFTLNTPFQPEPGAAGQAGGGSGGQGSFLTTQVTRRGENGYGAFGVANGGGQGGEGGWATSSSATARRAAGGGGGVFGADQMANTSVPCVDQTIFGLDAEPGFPGGASAFSAINTASQPPVGGNPGPSPFGDLGGTDDDFWGTKRKDFDTPTESLVVGELLNPHAGAGGGGGGDATRASDGVFPPPTLINSNSDKGCGGGGGAGSLTLLALGDINFGATGQITAIGGHGSGGENTGGTNRIGGGSGGGSGGHVILQTAGQIDVSAVPVGVMAIDARGGQGGAGENNNGGADEDPSTNRRDARHDGGPNDNPGIPPLDNECVTYTQSVITGTPTWVVRAAGGDGGPGVVQLHVGNLGGAANLHDVIYPSGIENNLGNVMRPYPHGYDGLSGRWVDQLLPIFGRQSKAQTEWVPLGGVTVAPGSPQADALAFLFDGIDTATGLVNVTGGVVDEVTPILAPAGAVEAPGLPEITGERTLRFDASALADDIYKLNPNLVERFGLKIGTSTSTVASAEYIQDGGSEYLDVTIASSDPVLTGQTGLVELVPRFFRVITQGTYDSIPSNASIQFEFQATVENSQGNPSEADNPGTPEDESPSAWVTDISALDTAQGATKTWSFLRYRVTFDIGLGGAPLNASTPRPTIEFLRMPFKF